MRHHAQMNTVSPAISRTPDEVRATLNARGISITRWANENGFKVTTVAAVLRGARGTRIGEGHRIAIALGMKRDPSQ